MNECRAFIELRRYIEECVIGGTFLLKLNELHSLYVELLKNLGIRKTIKKKLSNSSSIPWSEHCVRIRRRYEKHVK